jgi:aerobic carbon-monoxide dehydrogenase medium subunit
VKPAPFRYLRASDREEALALLAEHGDEGKVIAGGQSLAAVMNMRLSRPELLIDVDRLPGLSYVLLDGGELRVGALVRHGHVEHYPGVLGGHELLRRAMRFVGHYPIRTRGSVGGSIAHADPAAEWVLLATLLDAQVRAERVDGSRWVGADDFFHGFFTTALEPDELVTEVRFPRAPSRSAITEFARRHGDFAVVAAAVAFDLDDDGLITDPRVALAGVGSKAVKLSGAAEVLAGEPPELATFAAAAYRATTEIDPPADAHGDAAYRRQLARVLLTRALQEAVHDHR